MGSVAKRIQGMLEGVKTSLRQHRELIDHHGLLSLEVGGLCYACLLFSLSLCPSLPLSFPLWFIHTLSLSFSLVLSLSLSLSARSRVRALSLYHPELLPLEVGDVCVVCIGLFWVCIGLF